MCKSIHKVNPQRPFTTRWWVQYSTSSAGFNIQSNQLNSLVMTSKKLVCYMYLYMYLESPVWKWNNCSWVVSIILVRLILVSSRSRKKSIKHPRTTTWYFKQFKFKRLNWNFQRSFLWSTCGIPAPIINPNPVICKTSSKFIVGCWCLTPRLSGLNFCTSTASQYQNSNWCNFSGSI